MKKVVAIVLLLAFLALGGAGGLSYVLLADDDEDSAPTRVEPREDSGARTGAPEGLERFYDQRLTWEECDDHQCATLEVPLDYAAPQGRTIELKLLRALATDGRPEKGSLVVNPGGPGAAGTEYAALSGRAFTPAVTAAYDVVGFDPRGTGASAPVDCLSDEELDTYLAADPVPDTPEEVAAARSTGRDFGTGCVEKSGKLASHVSTTEAARDMDVLRAALGQEELHYLGASYGTKLGATYVELFPQRAGRVVLDGAMDPTISNVDLNLGQAVGFETALTAYVQNCLDTSGTCFLGDSVEAGKQRIADLLDQVDAKPLPTNDPDRPLTVGGAFYGIITPLYARESWTALTMGLRAAFGGNGAALQAMADLYASRGVDGYSDNSLEANYVINCLDDPASSTPEEIPALVKRFSAEAPTFGPVLAWSTLGCGGFTPRSTEKPLTLRGEGAAPLLVIGTTRDPATPMAWATALASQLESAVLVTRDGDGHTGYNVGNDCVDGAVEDLLLKGRAPEADITC